jgi:hypothetical protein
MLVKLRQVVSAPRLGITFSMLFHSSDAVFSNSFWFTAPYKTKKICDTLNGKKWQPSILGATPGTPLRRPCVSRNPDLDSLPWCYFNHALFSKKIWFTAPYKTKKTFVTPLTGKNYNPQYLAAPLVPLCGAPSVGNPCSNVISLIRWCLIYFPNESERIFTRTRSKLYIAICWIIPVLVVSPSLSGVWGRHGLEEFTQSCTIIKDKNGKSPKILLMTIGVALPGVILVIANTMIFFKVNQMINLFWSSFKVNCKLTVCIN